MRATGSFAGGGDEGGTASLVRARFSAGGGRTVLAQVREAGTFRLRVQRGADALGVFVNTGGGLLGGDTVRLDVTADAGSTLALTSVAAEKVYRAAGAPTSVETRLTLEPGARLDWLPQETILFDRARLHRRLRVELAPDSRFLGLEALIFGRLASGERDIAGLLDDGWDIVRAGRPIFADRVRLEGALGAALDRPTVGGGARAAATLVLASRDAAAHVEALRARLLPSAAVETGVSARGDVLVCRLLARSPDRLRAAMVAALGVLRSAPLPRSWG